MQPDTLISLIAARGLRVPFIPGGGRPEWTAQEAAMACVGVPQHIYVSLAYTYAGDFSQHSFLATALWGFGHTWRETDRNRDRWPELVNDEPYMHTLAEMLLLEIRQPWRFTRHENTPTPDLRRAILGCTKHEWKRDISPIYEAMMGEYVIWLATGLSCMRRWMRSAA